MVIQNIIITDKNSGITVSNSLDVTYTGTTGVYRGARASVGRKTGKWYMEYSIKGLTSTGNGVGIANRIQSVSDFSNNSGLTRALVYSNNAIRVYNGTATSYGASFTTGDTISILMDLDSKNIEFLKNGVSQGVLSLNLLDTEWYPYVVGVTPSFAVDINVGQRKFSYPLPYGYKPFQGINYSKMMIKDLESYYSINNNIISYSNNMTSDILPSPKKAKASSTLSASYSAFKAFDGQKTGDNSWVTANTIRSGWIELDFGKKTLVNKVKITSSDVSSTRGAEPKNFKIQGSNDGINYSDLLDVKNCVSWTLGETREFILDEIGNYKIYRVDVSENNGYSLYLRISEIQFEYITNDLVHLPDNSDITFLSYGKDSIANFDSIIESNTHVVTQDKILTLTHKPKNITII